MIRGGLFGKVHVYGIDGLSSVPKEKGLFSQLLRHIRIWSRPVAPASEHQTMRMYDGVENYFHLVCSDIGMINFTLGLLCPWGKNLWNPLHRTYCHVYGVP